jgi:hypothetical protein
MLPTAPQYVTKTSSLKPVIKVGFRRFQNLIQTLRNVYLLDD